MRKQLYLGILAVQMALFAPAQSASAGAELIMFEQVGCYWCGRWNDEISQIYPKTSEGKFAPLRRVDIHDPRPADLTAIANTVFTPTFVLVADGQEIGRIEGYPGEDFFWGLLTDMIKTHKNGGS